MLHDHAVVVDLHGAAVASWIMSRPGTLASGEQALLEVILDGWDE